MIENANLFNPGEGAQIRLDSIIGKKLDFVPEYPATIRSERQFYLEEGKLFVFYDRYTIGRAETYSIELSYTEIRSLINPDGPLYVFLREKIPANK